MTNPSPSLRIAPSRRLAEIFGREVLALLVSKGLLSPEWAERLLSWRHTGFNVHSRVRARTKVEAERVGKYMVRPILALDRLRPRSLRPPEFSSRLP